MGFLPTRAVRTATPGVRGSPLQPDWLGNTHHLIAGAILAGVLAFGLRRRVHCGWLLVSASLGSTLLAETINELVEWRLIRGGSATAAAYYDVVADLGMTTVGGAVGALASWLVFASPRRP